MTELDDYLKPIIELPQKIDRQLKDQEGRLSSTLKKADNSNNINDLSRKIDVLAGMVKSIPSSPKVKSVWLPMLSMAFIALCIGAVATLATIKVIEGENDQKFADRVKNSTLSSGNCEALGFTLNPQRDGSVWCMRLITPDKQ